MDRKGNEKSSNVSDFKTLKKMYIAAMADKKEKPFAKSRYESVPLKSDNL